MKDQQLLGADRGMDIEKMRIEDIPNSTMGCACNSIAEFTVGLLRIIPYKNREDIRLIGTGTLVTVGGLYCIFTAWHILAQFRDGDQLSLLSSFTGRLRRHRFDLSYVQIHNIAKGENDSKGPYIGLIVLPQTNIGWLLAEKTFFNIDRYRERFADAFLQTDLGCWLMCGIVGESEQILPPRPGFSTIKGYRGLCGASNISAEYEDSGFDYLELGVDYVPYNPKLPSSFGGFSGCGVWQVPLSRNDRDEIEPEEYVLSGVAFYQTDREKGFRLLRCHGRKTVYVKLPQFLQCLHRS